jgi:hypothetical protein
MFTSGGGGGALPNIDSPIELAIVLAVLAGLVWLGFRFFDS